MEGAFFHLPQLIHLTFLGDFNRAVTMVIGTKGTKLQGKAPEIDCGSSEYIPF